jgi:nucleoside-diphosphate-sugar epimerase
VRIVVLGGTRFIGRALVEELATHGHELLIVHRGRHEPEDLPESPHLHSARAELPQRAGELAGFRPDAVVDLSAMTAEDAEAALRAAPPGARLLAASSMDVYRAFGSVWAGTMTDPVPLTEESPLRTEPPPDRAALPEGWDFDPARYEKLDVERAYLARGATVCRLPMVYGEHDYQRREEPLLRRLRARRRRIPVGAGSWLWSRGYVRDVATGVRLALESEGAVGEVFNLCEPRCAPMRLWLEQILGATGQDAELVRVPDESLPEDLALTGTILQHLLVDPGKAQRLLGWEHGPVEEAVARSVRWHLDNPPAERDADFSADNRALGLDKTAEDRDTLHGRCPP